ncbi:TPA: hypothetical protein UN036_000015 [Stenotrophomonas maltophilia]|nr:hypothetical protein [Stenotrophomonas maltophilia]
MAKKRVPLHQNPRGYVDVDPDATNGAQVGVNLRGPDGQLLTAAQVINPTNGGSGGPGSIASTIWKLIKEIPLNIQKLAALIGAGLAVRKNDGEWALRTLQEGTGIDIANPDGDAGNPTIGLEDVPDSGAGTLLAITKDSKGRVTGTRPATITGTAQQINVANGNAAAGLPTLSLAAEVLASLGKADSAVQEVRPGTNVTVDSTDPRRPIVSATEASGIFLGGVELTSSFVNTTASGGIVPITGMTFSFIMPDRPVLISFGSTAFYDSTVASNLAAIILRVNGADSAQLFFSAAITNFWSQGKQYLLSGLAAGTTVDLSWWLNMGAGTFTVFGNPADKPYIYVVTV